MASQGPNGCGTGAASGAGTAWSNPTRITVNDGSFADSSLAAGGNSNQLQATNFGFSIPAGSTINGVLVESNQVGAGGEYFAKSA